MRIPPRYVRLSCSLFTLSLFAALLTGCGMGPAASYTPTPSAAISGVLYGGQQPIKGTTVSLYAFGRGSYGANATLLANAIAPTDANGYFQFAPGAYTCTQLNEPVYILGHGGNPGVAPFATSNPNIALGAAIGPCSGAPGVTVHINEVTTAALAYALSHFFTPTFGPSSTDSFGGPYTGRYPVGTYSQGLLAAANYTIPTLVNQSYGYAIPDSRGLDIVHEVTKINSIANALAACVNTLGETNLTETTTNCGKLFSYTTFTLPTGGKVRPYDTLQAAVMMCLHPIQNVVNIYNLPSPTAPFTPFLGAPPSDWTLGIAYFSAGMGLAVNTNTTSNIDIDATGRIWLPSSAISTGAAYFDPSTKTFTLGGASSAYHFQSLAIDGQNRAMIPDFNSNGLYYRNTLTNAYQGVGTGGITTSLASVAIGPADDIVVQYQNGAAYGVLGINPAITAYTFIDALSHTPTSVAAATFPAGEAILDATFTSGTGSFDEDYVNGALQPLHSYGNLGATGGIALTSLSTMDDLITIPGANEICSYASGCISGPISNPQGIAVDGDGYSWIADAGNSAIIYFTPGPNYTNTGATIYFHNSTYGNTLYTPYGIAIDNSGNVWASNAGCITTGCTPGTYYLSELIGAAAPTIAPLSAQTINKTTATRPTQ